MGGGQRLPHGDMFQLSLKHSTGLSQADKGKTFIEHSANKGAMSCYRRFGEVLSFRAQMFQGKDGSRKALKGLVSHPRELKIGQSFSKCGAKIILVCI